MTEEQPGSGAGYARRSGKPAHALAIVILFLGLTLIYYVEQLIDSPRLSDTFFTGVRDLHRTFFLIPILYAALVFRSRGALIASFAFFCIVLPRALFLSPYPDPLLRASISVFSSAAIGLLVAIWRNRLESERAARQNLSAAYEELKIYDKRLKENQAMLVQAEKLASMGQLAASMAHEVNNPLSGVLVYIQLLKKKIARGDIDREVILDNLSKVDQELTRSTKLIRNMLDFSRESIPTIKEVDVCEVIDRSLELALHACGARVDVEQSPCALPKIMTDPNQLQAVLINLIMNACQAMPEGGKLSISADLSEGQVKIAVRDTGCGIPPEHMAKIFTPFFSTKKEVKGVGLGLAVSYGIIQRLNGKIEVESRVGEGSTFTVCLPATEA